MPQPEPTWPEAVVFDFDGLLVDTTSCWHRAYAEALSKTGRKLDAVLVSALAGASVEGAAAQLDVSAAELRSGLLGAFKSQSFVPLPGAREIVKRLRRHAPLGVATNGPSMLVSSVLREVGLIDEFDVILSAETQRQGKPAPDVYRAVCSQLKVDPSQAVAFEDSPIGVLAARRAGLTVVYVPSDGQHADADFHANGLDDPRLLRFLDEG